MITSPYLNKSDKQVVYFEKKIKDLFLKEKVDGAFIYYRKDDDIGVMKLNICCHELAELGASITKEAENLAENCCN